MSNPDEVNTGSHPIAAGTMLMLADPDKLKVGFGRLVDSLINETAGSIIDWGTTNIVSQRIIDTRDGTEIIQIAMTVGLLVADGA